jgi:hypothetical protein
MAQGAPTRGVRTPAARGGRPPPGLSRTKGVIRLDTRAIRRKALQEHQKAQRALDQLKLDLQRYHERDVPGFRSWIHKTFGHLLTRQRELQQALQEKESLIRECAEIAYAYALSEVEAYRKVMWRRAHPQEAQAEDLQRMEEERQRWEALQQKRQQGRVKGDGEQDWDEMEEDERDEEWAEDEDEDDYLQFLKEFGRPRGAAGAGKSGAAGQQEVKELYRQIVQRLHPDRHGQMTDARAALWHEAQEAYRRHDLNALHSVLTRCDAGEAGLGDHSPVSRIKHMTQQLKKAARSARSDLHNLKRDVAWHYEDRLGDKRYVRQVGQSLEELVARLQRTFHEVEWALNDLARQANREPRPRRTPAKKKQKAAQPAPDDEQTELPF